MTRLEMKNCNMTLKKKQEEYQHYHQVKLIKEILPSGRKQII